jgi:hypothetical protein
MSHDQKELGNKLGAYADTITAFSFLQSATFSYALGTNDTFLAHATRVWWLVPSFPIVGNLFYAYLVLQCHSGEDALLEPLESPGGAWKNKVRKWRMAVIALGLVLSLVAYVGSFYGIRHPPETHPTHKDAVAATLGTVTTKAIRSYCDLSALRS